MKYRLTPKPPCPVAGVSVAPFQYDWDTTFSALPQVGVVPPTAVAFGESAGTPTVLGAPSRHVLPESPDPFTTVTPLAAAFARIESIAWASACGVWSSHWVHEFEITVSPSAIIAWNIWAKLVLGGAS